jgi:cysteine desulfurase
VNGGGAPRVAGTLNLSFDGVLRDGIVMALDLEGYSVSSGSACSSGALEPSHVLLAMGRSAEEATAALRVSFCDTVDWETLERFTAALAKVVERMRKAGNWTAGDTREFNTGTRKTTTAAPADRL